MTNSAPEFNIDNMNIRLATTDDVPTLRELFEQSRIDGQTRENDTGADLDHLMAGYFECKDSGFWVAEFEENTVGMIGVQRINDSSAEIRRLRVSNSYQRKGIGTKLMQHAVSYCRKKHFLKVVLDVRIERGPAIRMFDSFGFLHGRERDLDGRKLRDFYLDLYTDTPETFSE